MLIMAYGTEEGIWQKGIAEYQVAAKGFDLLKLSRFDVSEETFKLKMDAAKLSDRVERIIEAAPDALLLTGCPPEFFVVLVDRLRSGGFTGLICAQNFQDARLLSKLGSAADGVFYMGGGSTDALHSEYYDSLKAGYLDLAGEWSEEAETKLYALEFIIACLKYAGADALRDTTGMYRALQNIEFEDPFYTDNRIVPVAGGGAENRPWQLLTPIRISKMSGGEAHLVKQADCPKQ